MTPVTHSASSVSPASVADTEATTATVGILAGMGPAAGVDFARLFLQSCDACLLERGPVSYTHLTLPTIYSV